MNITNLENSPQFVQKTLNLIEESFEYSKENHFDVDFYPLYNKDNFKNCFILTKDDEVIAHIGRVERKFTINKDTFPISMFGGIAVAKQARGKGHFKDFFTELLKNETQTTLSFLWSDKTELYERFGFFPCAALQSYSQKESNSNLTVETKTFANLTDLELQKISDLYNHSPELRLTRTDLDWKNIKKISSAHLYLVYERDELVNYFLKDKGEDLANTIHEYGYIDLEHLDVMRNFGQVWTTLKNHKDAPQELFGSIIKINNTHLFESFVKNYTGIEITRNRHNFIDFKFNGFSYQLPQKDFLQGLLGPGRFEELNEVPYLYICGVDSI